MKQLPVVQTPMIVDTLPVSNKKIQYRPFLNKEKKALMLAKESEDWKATNATIREVILSCTNGSVDIDQIPVADSAWMFIKLRIQSIGNLIPITTKCKKCGEEFQLNYNLDDVKVSNLDKWNPIIRLNSEVGMTVRCPTIAELEYATETTSDDFLISMIVNIFDSETVYDPKEYTKEELIEWLDQLNDDNIKKIEEALKYIPTLEQDIKYQCPKCRHEENIHLEGLSDFF